MFLRGLRADCTKTEPALCNLPISVIDSSLEKSFRMSEKRGYV